MAATTPPGPGPDEPRPDEPRQDEPRQKQPSVEGIPAWQRLLRMSRPRATRANAFAALLAIGLGFAIATQVQQTNNSGLDQLREDELVRILDDVSQEQDRLTTDTRALEITRDRLLSGADTSAEALKAAQERADTLGILTGTSPAKGPGIVITITDPDNKVTGARLLDALQELRDAGAEAVQINDVRVVADTWFDDVDGGIEVSGRRISAPYTIRAIGDSATMASAMDIPGGVTESIRRDGANSTTRQSETVEITALHSVEEARYARPVPARSN
ncbi:DUF881 domain-containing protein [Knoellia koreensis]|jgi:uncharacterized protein YlxW (UPF0749 family)|uniref:DUF881 domain-containing protein n=1 Tax=Knoellia koreensis TaxID=2730921 RepID=A0A849H5G3_9MICO|nr:DUF881 domain-containing protein [Knoellia sp. DB2414S]NNM45016.1 DUF881 domain-containing protein [Knoellia sp. DB2414S]